MRSALVTVKEVPKGHALDGKTFRPVIYQMDAHPNLGLGTKIRFLHHLVRAGNCGSIAG